MPQNVMCKNCNNYRNNWCERVIDSPDPNMVRDCRHFWQRTNADRIRAMSDDELVDILYQFAHSNNKPLNKENLFEWLKQPAEVGNG